MKNVYLLLLCLFVGACDSDYPLISPVYRLISIYVQNEKGEDLFNPETEGNLRDSCKILYNGKKIIHLHGYLADNNAFEIKETDIDPENDNSLEGSTKQFYLSLFFFCDEQNHHTFVLTWSDGNKDIIHFYRDPISAEEEFTLNGKEIDSPHPYEVFITK